MADLIGKAKRILQAVDLYHEAPTSASRADLRRVIHDELERAGIAAIRELENIVNAKRFDRERFDSDTGFADWVQSRARHTLAECRKPELWPSTHGVKQPNAADLMILAAGAASGDPGTFKLAAQLAGVPACDGCGYRKEFCRCVSDGVKGDSDG